MNDFQIIDTDRVVTALLILKDKNPSLVPIINCFMDCVNRESLKLVAENAVNFTDELIIQTNLTKMSGIDFAVNAIMSAIIEEGEKK